MDRPPGRRECTPVAFRLTHEAPFIALLILMHQKREAHIDELREEFDLQVSLFLEREVTVVLRMLKQG